jgi:hypothetical protein
MMASPLFIIFVFQVILALIDVIGIDTLNELVSDAVAADMCLLSG